LEAIITYSVGDGGINRPSDVAVVQVLLNSVRAQWQVPSSDQILVDGLVGPQTIGAIRDFQKYFVTELTNPDGRVDPGKATINKLSVMSRYLPPLNDGEAYLLPDSAPDFLA
jgi:hypothetical protein